MSLPITRSLARPLARSLAASPPALFAARPKFTIVTAFARPKSTMADQTIVYTKEAPFRESNSLFARLCGINKRAGSTNR